MADNIMIDSDDPGMVPLLRELEEQVRDAGGHLSPRLRVVVREGQARVESDAKEGERLLRIPRSCLPVVDDVGFRLDGDELAVASSPAAMTSPQREVLRVMLAIYNRGGKIAAHRRESPWLALADRPGLLKTLHAGRRDAPKLTRWLEAVQAGGSEGLVADSFIATRALRYRFDEGDAGRVVTPFIDFFNHHAAGASFGRDGDALAVDVSHPVAGSSECLVRYGPLDALDAYLNYGFADTSAPFLRSVPLRIGLEGGGVIDVLGRVARAKKNLPDTLETLRGWVPRYRRGDDGGVVASQLLVPPPGGIDVFANVLALLIRPLMPDAGRDRLSTAVMQAMQTVVLANERYYEVLGDALGAERGGGSDAAALAELQRTIDFQQAWLARWRQRLAANARAAADGVAVTHQSRGGGSWA